MPGEKLTARLRRRLGRAPGYDDFIARVEPELSRTLRVHRFGLPPVCGPDDRGASLPAVHAGATRETVPAALADTSADWVVLVADGDTLAPTATERLGQAIALAPGADVLTCDDDRLGPKGRHSPRLYGGPAPETSLVRAPGSLLCVRREAALRAVADRPLGISWRHDLLLSLAGSDAGAHAHLPQILCHRRDGDSEQAPGPVPRSRLETEPTVDVVVLFKDKPELLRRCVETLTGDTRWDRLGVILVDNGSTDPEIAPLVERLTKEPRVTAMRDDRPFNFAALNNAGARRSSADFLVFLNNDTAVMDPEWLERLLEQAVQPHVGAVGPMLLYDDGRVQHAGVAIGMHGYAGHPFQGLHPDAPTAFGTARGGTRNWLAVTAACMLVERAKFDAVGSFDERFVVGGNDVDLCLRLTAAGHRSLCLTDVEMLHDEGRSRGQYVDPGDFAESERSYGEFRTVGDPFYNPNLTLARTDCSLRTRDEVI